MNPFAPRGQSTSICILDEFYPPTGLALPDFVKSRIDPNPVNDTLTHLYAPDRNEWVAGSLPPRPASLRESKAYRSLRQGHTRFLFIVYLPGALANYPDQIVAVIYPQFVTALKGTTVYYRSDAHVIAMTDFCSHSMLEAIRNNHRVIYHPIAGGVTSIKKALNDLNARISNTR